ncbi:uncharacterized protein LY89DRAFT_717624 [Mollisia scopiformis]|uniref:Uncharacterized protein n=1 Tax=Mollisia scopiformis TaxID=149040 RepID=A0A194XE14_MOLSC|nr:uncharacterized protein LY89DRAFT_717624 [Mollisia scopiformis]KUJ17992.1 hypothetical protein LY89DRAFT_717624 [Mollisia scopiformis]
MAFNGNITLPAGATSHGQPDLLCLPTKWTDIVVFFMGNYVAHAATIRLEPSTSIVNTVLAIVLALLIPISGVKRGIKGIMSFAKFGKTDLQVAARAGALCQVIQTDMQARSFREQLLTAFDHGSIFAGKIHSRYRLPDGYGFATVPWNSKFQNDDAPAAQQITLAANYNIVSILVALAQLAFAVATIYRSRGDQITQYGYAAFGLTVTQYAAMSLVNLLGNLVCPQYTSIYLVRSTAMTDAEAEPGANAFFEGVVGTLLEDEIQADEAERRASAALLRPPKSTWARIGNMLNLRKIQTLDLLLLPVSWMPTAVSVAIIYGLSRFEEGSSTFGQRAATMGWLAMGSWAGALGGWRGNLERDMSRRKIYSGYLLELAISLVSSVPSVAGYIVVAGMLEQYGICSHV